MILTVGKLAALIPADTEIYVGDNSHIGFSPVGEHEVNWLVGDNKVILYPEEEDNDVD